jgi:hypothetical protein
MARRAIFGVLAPLVASGCAYAPSFTHGPPYGDDLVREHHDAFPAPSEHEARFSRIRHFGSQRRCETYLDGIGEVVRLSAYETVAHRRVAHEGRAIVEEHHCGRETLKIRAWYEQPHESEADPH